MLVTCNLIRLPCGNILLGKAMVVCGSLIYLFFVKVMFMFGYIVAIVNREVGGKKEERKLWGKGRCSSDFMFCFYDFHFLNPLAEFYERLKQQNVIVNKTNVN